MIKNEEKVKRKEGRETSFDVLLFQAGDKNEYRPERFAAKGGQRDSAHGQHCKMHEEMDCR
jgi:hypothetical protein